MLIAAEHYKIQFLCNFLYSDVSFQLENKCECSVLTMSNTTLVLVSVKCFIDAYRLFVFADQDIDDRSFTLLSDADLRDLGFSMGHRRLLCNWIQQNSTSQAHRASETVRGPVSSLSSSSTNDIILSSPVSSSTPVARRPQASQFKVCILL